MLYVIVHLPDTAPRRARYIEAVAAGDRIYAVVVYFDDDCHAFNLVPLENIELSVMNDRSEVRDINTSLKNRLT